MIINDLRPMSSAPLDGTSVRLFVFAGSVIASFWSEGGAGEIVEIDETVIGKLDGAPKRLRYGGVQR